MELWHKNDKAVLAVWPRKIYLADCNPEEETCKLLKHKHFYQEAVEKFQKTLENQYGKLKNPTVSLQQFKKKYAQWPQKHAKDKQSQLKQTNKKLNLDMSMEDLEEFFIEEITEVDIDDKPKFSSHKLKKMNLVEVFKLKNLPPADDFNKGSKELAKFAGQIVTEALKSEGMECADLECPTTGLQFRDGGGQKSAMVHTDHEPPEDVRPSMDQWWYNLDRQFKFTPPDGSWAKENGKEKKQQHLSIYQYFNIWVCYDNCDQRALAVLYDGMNSKNARTWYSTKNFKPGDAIIFDGFFSFPHTGVETSQIYNGIKDKRSSGELRCRCKIKK